MFKLPHGSSLQMPFSPGVLAASWSGSPTLNIAVWDEGNPNCGAVGSFFSQATFFHCPPPIHLLVSDIFVLYGTI